jgi:hypothetical protein
MRIPSVLLALVFGLASSGAVSAAEQPQPSLYSPALSVKPDWLNRAAEAIPIDKSHPANGRPKFDLRNLGSIHLAEDGDKVCYTMRSYIVARENKGSDSTKLVGYSICQPSSKYELKITFEDPKE